MKVVVLFSGGKDSTFTLWIALQQYEVISLITVLSDEESYLYHYQQKLIVDTLQEAIGLPIQSIIINKSEDELPLLEQKIKELGAEAILIGGLLSEYQRTRFNSVAMNLNIPCFAPLWRKDHILLLEELKNHFEIIFTTVASMGFTEKDVGRLLDDEMMKHLKNLNKKFGVSIGGEGGEYETLALDAPFYTKRIIIEEAIVEWNEKKSFGYYKILKLKTVPKNYEQFST